MDSHRYLSFSNSSFSSGEVHSDMWPTIAHTNQLLPVERTFSTSVTLNSTPLNHQHHAGMSSDFQYPPDSMPHLSPIFSTPISKQLAPLSHYGSPDSGNASMSISSNDEEFNCSFPQTTYESEFCYESYSDCVLLNQDEDPDIKNILDILDSFEKENEQVLKSNVDNLPFILDAAPKSMSYLVNENKVQESDQNSCLSSIVSNNTNPSVSSNSKVKSRYCLVCNNIAKGVNFGAVTCDCCKAFFRRNAKLPEERRPVCKYSNSCVIERDTSKTSLLCGACRLEKCLSVGMRKELILTDEQKEERRLKSEQNKLQREAKKQMKLHRSKKSNISKSEICENVPAPNITLFQSSASHHGWWSRCSVVRDNLYNLVFQDIQRDRFEQLFWSYQMQQLLISILSTGHQSVSEFMNFLNVSFVSQINKELFHHFSTANQNFQECIYSLNVDSVHLAALISGDLILQQNYPLYDHSLENCRQRLGWHLANIAPPGSDFANYLRNSMRSIAQHLALSSTFITLKN